MDLKDRRIHIIIWCDWPFRYTSGGILASFYLCECINNLNHKNFYSHMYLPNNQEKINSFPHVNYINDDKINPDDNTLVIYPETVSGNPLSSKHVVRWIMGRSLRLLPTWKNTDLIYFWDHKVEKTFKIPYFNSIFKNNNKKERTDTCYIIYKGSFMHDNINFFHPNDSILIYPELGLEEISNIFNKCKYFYCYDPMTAYIIYAVSCGCITILYPEKDKTKEEYFKGSFFEKNNKIYNYGIAYGNSEEQIKFATDTLEEGEFMYKELFKLLQKDSLFDFLKDLEIYFN